MEFGPNAFGTFRCVDWVMHTDCKLLKYLDSAHHCNQNAFEDVCPSLLLLAIIAEAKKLHAQQEMEGRQK